MNNLKYSLTAILLFLSLFSGHAQAELATKTFFNNLVELELPEDFTLMDEEMLNFKYPSANRPTIVYTNEAGSINVALNYLDSPANQNSLDKFHSAIVAQYKSSFPTAKWKNSGIVTVNDRKLGYIEIITPAIDTEIYNLLFYTDVNGRLLICTFNCTVKDMGKWELVAKDIRDSLKAKD